MRLATVVVGKCILRVEPDRLTEVGDGAIVLALGGVRVAAVVIGQRIFWIEPDRLVAISQCRIAFTLVVIRQASAVVGQCILRLEPDRFTVVGDGTGVVALGIVCIAAVVVHGFGCDDAIRRDAVFGKLLSNTRLDRFGGGDVGARAAGIALFQLYYAAAIER